jgi:hypothetical protein
MPATSNVAVVNRISSASLVRSVANAPSVQSRTGTGTTSNRRLKPLAKSRNRPANSASHAVVVAVVAAAIARVATTQHVRTALHKPSVRRTLSPSTRWP